METIHHKLLTKLRSILSTSSSTFKQIRNCTFGQSDIAQCYITLGVPVNCDQETVRQAFLDLVKRFHPDSKSKEADAVKFYQIETAYRKLQENFAKQRFKKDDCEGEYGLYYQEKVEEHDIKHTAPQHRQYLSYGGYGLGSPAQRERQFAQFRASKAVENVTEYRISKLNDKFSKELITKEQKKKVKDTRTGFGMDRLVEDLIQESMMRGEFDNLTGAGKPLDNLQRSHNPYVDFVTHKMNEVLIDNGFTPQWITLQKEIRDQSNAIKQSLVEIRMKLGPLPLDEDEKCYWTDSVNRISNLVKDLNNKIDTYNLVVPILDKQMFHFNLKTESEKVLVESPPGERFVKQSVTAKDQTEPNKKHFLDFVNYIFERKL